MPITSDLAKTFQSPIPQQWLYHAACIHNFRQKVEVTTYITEMDALQPKFSTEELKNFLLLFQQAYITLFF